MDGSINRELGLFDFFVKRFGIGIFFRDRRRFGNVRQVDARVLSRFHVDDRFVKFGTGLISSSASCFFFSTIIERSVCYWNSLVLRKMYTVYGACL